MAESMPDLAMAEASPDTEPAETSSAEAAAAFLEKDADEAEAAADAAADAAAKAQDEAAADELRKSNTAPATMSLAEEGEASELCQTKSSLYEQGADASVPLERLRKGKNALANMTPRAVEACTREGIEPEELLKRPLQYFRGLPTEGVRERHAVKRHARYEEARIFKLDLVSATRMQLLEEGWPPTEEQQIAAAAGGTLT